MPKQRDWLRALICIMKALAVKYGVVIDAVNIKATDQQAKLLKSCSCKVPMPFWSVPGPPKFQVN